MTVPPYPPNPGPYPGGGYPYGMPPSPPPYGPVPGGQLPPPGMYPPPGPGFPPLPPPAPKKSNTALIAAIIGVLVLLIAGGLGAKSLLSRDSARTASPGSSSVTSVRPADPAVQSSATECAIPKPGMLTVEGRAADEPTIKVALPEGWTRITKLDSDLIRLTVAAPGLTANGSAPNAVATMEKMPANLSAEELFDAQLFTVRTQFKDVEILSDQPAMVCGLAARYVVYNAPELNPGIRVLLVADPQDEATWVVTFTVQSRDPENPTYQKDLAALMDGFQVIPAGGWG